MILELSMSRFESSYVKFELGWRQNKLILTNHKLDQACRSYYELHIDPFFFINLVL